MKEEALKLALSCIRSSAEYKRGNASFIEAAEDVEQALAAPVQELHKENPYYPATYIGEGWQDGFDGKALASTLEPYRRGYAEGKADARAIEQALAAPVCSWVQVDDLHTPDTWEAECGAMWTFTEGGPKDNNMTFCPECGKTLEQKGGEA